MPEYTATLKQTATNAIIGCNVQLFIQFIISIDTEERCSLFKKNVFLSFIHFSFGGNSGEKRMARHVFWGVCSFFSFSLCVLQFGGEQNDRTL